MNKRGDDTGCTDTFTGRSGAALERSDEITMPTANRYRTLLFGRSRGGHRWRARRRCCRAIEMALAGAQESPLSPVVSNSQRDRENASARGGVVMRERQDMSGTAGWNAIRLMAGVVALSVFAGCATAPPLPPYRPLRGQSLTQLRIDSEECWRGRTAEEWAGIVFVAVIFGALRQPPWAAGLSANPGQRVHDHRMCMRERGYCSIETYEPGYWTRDSNGNFEWHEPVHAPDGFCKQER